MKPNSIIDETNFTCIQAILSHEVPNLYITNTRLDEEAVTNYDLLLMFM